MNCSSLSCLKQFLKFRAFFPLGKKKDQFCCLSSHLVFMQNQFSWANWEVDSISLCISSREYFSELQLESNSWLWAAKQETTWSYKCSWGWLFVVKSLLLLLMPARKRIQFDCQMQSEFVGWTVKKKEVCSAVSWAHLLMCPWHLEAFDTTVQIPFPELPFKARKPFFFSLLYLFGCWGFFWLVVFSPTDILNPGGLLCLSNHLKLFLQEEEKNQTKTGKVIYLSSILSPFCIATPWLQSHEKKCQIPLVKRAHWKQTGQNWNVSLHPPVPSSGRKRV